MSLVEGVGKRYVGLVVNVFCCHWAGNHDAEFLACNRGHSMAFWRFAIQGKIFLALIIA